MSQTKKAPATEPAIEDKEAANRIESVISEAKTALQDGASATRDNLKTAQEEVQQHLSTATEKSVAFVRENPGLALAGALGLGVLLGVALRKSDRG